MTVPSLFSPIIHGAGTKRGGGTCGTVDLYMDLYVMYQIVIRATKKIKQGHVLERGWGKGEKLPGGADWPHLKWQEGHSHQPPGAERTARAKALRWQQLETS